jgi:hypothetical protein
MVVMVLPYLIPATASLSPAERMMLLDSLNFLLMFLTPLGSHSSFKAGNFKFLNTRTRLVVKKSNIGDLNEILDIRR